MSFAETARLGYTVDVRIGSVPYLNARPLVDWLERHPRPEVFSLRYAVPSALIEELLAGTLDVVMASTYAVLAHPELHLLPGLGVTTTGEAWSVRLFSRVPPAAIRTLALDMSSRSSTAMARIVLADGYGVTPACVDRPPNLADMLAEADAAVLIGDIGMSVDGGDAHVLDLGAAWYNLTGLPFYFAGWVARDRALLDASAPLFIDALEHGLSYLPQIAAEEALRLALPETLCYDYLAKIMRYRTGPVEEAGLAEFAKRAQRLGLV